MGVKQTEIPDITPIQRLVLSSAGKRADVVRHVIALDNECARIARQAKEPMMAQIRLAWWRDGLLSSEALPAHRSPQMDALRALAGFASIRDALVAVLDGWEELILWDGGDPQAMLKRYAHGRGTGFFEAVAPEMQGHGRWGAAWALWDLAGNLDEPGLHDAAISQGREMVMDVEAANVAALPRSLAMLAGAARHDLRQNRGMPPHLTPGLYMRLLRLQLFGR